MPTLSKPRQEKTCQEYVLNGGDKSKAYRAGHPNTQRWKDNVVWTKACEFFKRGDVLVRVEELKAEAAKVAQEKFKVDAQYVLGRLVEMDQLDVADILDSEGFLKPVTDWPVCWRRSINGMDVVELFDGRGDEREKIGMLKKIKMIDRVKNLELLGKHIEVQAFKERVDVHEHKAVEDMTDEELDREINKRLGNAST